MNWNWLVNGTNYDESLFRYYIELTVISGNSYLTINQLITDFNNTIVYCTAISSSGIIESSQESQIILQGITIKFTVVNMFLQFCNYYELL